MFILRLVTNIKYNMINGGGRENCINKKISELQNSVNTY